MTPEEREAARLGLTVEKEFSHLQKPRPGHRALLAAVYPEDRRIVLFELNIKAVCRTRGIDPEAKREALIRHELYHFRRWLGCRRQGRRWHPRHPVEEREARRAEAGLSPETGSMEG